MVLRSPASRTVLWILVDSPLVLAANGALSLSLTRTQIGLLPSEHYLDAVCACFELHAALRPARTVGGDLYSYFLLEPQRFFVMVGDVSDKGIPAALFMAQTIILAKARAPRARTPRNLLQLLNLELLSRLGDGGTVVVDLAGLEYVSSAGLRSFARIR